jgi:electron transfer flavoprotein alpha subunit
VILVIAEHGRGELNRATWETVAAAQLLAKRLGGLPIKIVVPGGSDRVAQELASAGVGDVLTLVNSALELYTPDGYVMAVATVMASVSPRFVVVPHISGARLHARARGSSQ